MTACSHAHTASVAAPMVLLVGHPNVGKSVLFHRLTGNYVTVSNYPGTTVDIARAPMKQHEAFWIMDTPGVLALPSRSDDEQATVRAILHENSAVIVQVGDAKNLRRTLSLTAVLVEFGLPMVLVLNMQDEAEARGIVTDVDALSSALGIAVIATVATDNVGMDALVTAIGCAAVPDRMLHYDAATEKKIIALMERMAVQETFSSPVAPRALALLALGEDPVILSMLDASDRCAEKTGGLPVKLIRERVMAADHWVSRFSSRKAQSSPQLAHRIGQWVVHPWYSLPILAIILSIVYLWVGVLGATTLVGLLEEDLFENRLTPMLTGWIEANIPFPFIVDLLVGPYGLWTMGMTYAIALILPIVTTFFLAFGFLEDSGYFSRLSVLANRVFTVMGLNGRAILPMILGLGCVTMATLTTRILHSPRERLIATFLLALAIPCSAQLGVVMGMLGKLPLWMTLVWMGVMLLILALSGFLAARLIPGKRIPLVTELPPMRVPMLANVIKKTSGRLRWYLVEVIPLFLMGTLLMFTLDRTGAMPAIIRAGEPLVTGWLGLPAEASAAFIMGFLRRDFGATGLFVMSDRLTPEQMLVGMITITLFIPCFASLMMMIKEHGMRVAMTMLAFIIPLAFLIGGGIHHALTWLPLLLSRVWV
ncbi:MAG: hypothetical protein RIQ52_1891 [Pseudomonadota bacterium]